MMNLRPTPEQTEVMARLMDKTKQTMCAAFLRGLSNETVRLKNIITQLEAENLRLRGQLQG